MALRDARSTLTKFLASLRDASKNDDYVKSFEKSCVVPDDDSEVVTHAHPATERDRAAIREQQISKMQYDPVAVQQRELKIAFGKSQLLNFRRKRG
jgi:hypothetical protein